VLVVVELSSVVPGDGALDVSSLPPGEAPPVASLVFVVLVLVLECELDPPPAGDGFTIVVLCSVDPGDPAGVTVSVRCSQAARSAALARMQMYFFIDVCGCP
jgi:hypothetical protein